MMNFYFKILFISILLNFYCASAQVVVNEIQAAPPNDEPEWIELYNYGLTDFTFSGATISDAIREKSLPDFTIKSNKFAILTSDSNKLIAKRNIPENCLLIQISMPQFNNDFDNVILRNNNIILDSVYYDLSWGHSGVSLERVDYLLPAFSNVNLQPSLSADSATCGYANSRAIRDNDVALDSMLYHPLDNSIEIIIYNKGRADVLQTHLTLLIDVNKDGIFKQTETYFEKDIELIKSKTEYKISIPIATLSSSKALYGSNQFKAYLFNSKDEINTNDSLTKDFFLSYPFGSMLINEFLNSSQNCNCEFIELFNSRDDDISLDKWFLRDASAPLKLKPYQINDSNFLIKSHDYAVIVFDSNCINIFPELGNANNITIINSSINLNSTGDEIILFDQNFIIADSLEYNSDWITISNENHDCLSFEKINPYLISSFKSNWSNSKNIHGATPGKENSNFIPFDSSGEISAKPNPFSPYSSGKDNVCAIKYKINFNDSKISAKIFDLNGIRVRTIVDSEILPAEGMLFCDGKNEHGFNVQIGPYVLLFEAEDIVNHNFKLHKQVIVVGK